MSSTEKPFIFGVKIDNITQKEVFSQINTFLASNNYYHIVTLNPEILLKSRKNRAYQDILNTSALNTIDGIGIRFALLRQGKHLKTRLAGVDLMYHILQKVNSIGGTVFLAVNSEGLCDWHEIKDVLTNFYPRISFIGKNIELKNYAAVINEISADVVLCNFGAPEQEMFLHELNDSHAKIGVGIGGAFDFLTGALPRAPRWMRHVGMEWLYRLYKQPRRWKRIYNAVIIFPILIVFNKK